MLSLLALIFYAAIFVTSSDTLDLQIYLDSAERLRHGQSLYEVRYSFPERASDFELQYLYPPALAALLAPVSFIPRPTLILLWQLGLVAALTASAVILSRLVCSTIPNAAQRLSPLIVFPFLAFWPPTLDGILWGQVNGYILLLLVGAAYSATCRDDRASGIAVGLAAALKGTPIVLAIPLLVHRRWRALAWCVGAGIAAHLPLLAYQNGLHAIPEFIATTREIASGHVVNDPNYDYSLRRVVSMFMEASPSLLSACSLGMMLLFLLVTALQQRNSTSLSRESDTLCGLQMVSAIPVMMLISPLVWFHHLVWLFPVFLITKACSASAIIRCVAVGSYILLTPLLYVHVFIRHFTDLGEWIIKPVPILITALSYVLVTVTLSRRTQAQRSADSEQPSDLTIA